MKRENFEGAFAVPRRTEEKTAAIMGSSPTDGGAETLQRSSVIVERKIGPVRL